MVTSEYIPIKPETVKAFADEARRLGGVDGELSTPQMKEIFAGVPVLPIAEDAKIQKSKSYYNGVPLPELPADVLAERPYCLVYLRADGVNYRALFGQYKWYYKASSDALFITTSAYSVYKATADSESWEYETGYHDGGNFGLSNGVTWANHDIATSENGTDVWFAGSEPVTESESLRIQHDTLVSFLEQAQRLGGVSGSLTIDEMLEIFSSV